MPTQLLPSSQGGISGTYPSLVFVLLLPLPLPFCNDGQAATVKLVHLLKHSVYFGLGDQPPFIGEIDLSLLVPPFDAPGPEPNKVQPSRAWIRQSPWHSGDRLSARAAFVGSAVRAAGWMVVFGHRGAFNAALLWLGVVRTPLEIMFTPVAVIVGITGVNLPFMVLTLQSVIEGIDPVLEEAALGLGAPPLAVFRRVTLPLSLPGVVAGSLLCFILAMNAYATPVLLGGPRFQMMAPVVYTQISEQANWPLGGALAFVLMAATLLMTVGAGALVRRRSRQAH